MSNFFKNLSTYVCQKLVIIFEKISKKYLKLQGKLDGNKANGIQASDKSADSTEISTTDALKDIPIFEEVLRTVLEIINACLTKNLLANPNLIYTLLYNRKVFDPFLTNSSFQDIIINIETVLDYFSKRIESFERTLSVEEILEIIKQSSLNWPSEKLKVVFSCFHSCAVVIMVLFFAEIP